MRDLPDNASLDHLRRQAKDQLAVLRRTTSDATLTVAQTTVARQYGFGSWAELKTEVERRNDDVEPPPSADDHRAEQLAAAFGLGTVTGPMTHVERQWTGEIWDLTTTDGRWVLTALADFVVPANVETEAGLVEQARAAGILALEPVRTTDGPIVAALDGVHWRAHRWIPLGPPAPQPPLPATAAEGGRILARLHRLDLTPPAPVVPWLTHRCSESQWQALVDQARAAGKVWADDLARALPGFLALDAVRDPRDPNPRAVLSKAWHAPAAVRLAGDDRLVVLGWEHTCAIPRDWDLGSSLMAWSETVDSDHDPDAARAFLAGYRELADGVDVDIELPIFTSGVTAALNWTISRANIALNADDPTQRDIAERNVRALARHPVTLDRIRRLADALT